MKKLISTLLLFFSFQAYGGQGKSQVSVALSEGFMPNQLRLTISDVDVIIGSILNVSIGQRYWSQSSYLGFGFGIGRANTPGIYGTIGREFFSGSIVPISLEFSAFGSPIFGTKSKIHLHIGVAW